MRMGRLPTPSHHTGIAPVVRAVWVAGSGLHTTHRVQGWVPNQNPSVLRCGYLCVCPSCRVCKVSSVHPIQCCSRTHKGNGATHPT